MIHAFVAGFAGAIGVLVALWMWGRVAAWRDGKAARRERRERRRLVAEERHYRRCVEQKEREQQHLDQQEQRRRVRTQRGDWPTDIFGWVQVSFSVVLYVGLFGWLISAVAG